MKCFGIFLFCLVATTSWAGNDEIDLDNTPEQFQKWAEARAMCQNYPYVTNEVDRKLPKRLRKLGIDVQRKKTKDLYEGVITPKAGVALKFFGQEGQNITFYLGKENSFFVRVKASARDLFTIINKRQLDKYPPLTKVDDENILYFSLTSQAYSYAPFGQEKTAVVIKKTAEEGIFEIGCQKFD